MSRITFVTLNLPFGWYLLIILGSSLLCSPSLLWDVQHHFLPTQSCIPGFIFLKRSIQPSEAQKPSIPRWAATCRAFSFRWGQLMEALAVQACLNHAKRMVSSSSNVEVFRDLSSLENNGQQHCNFSLFQTVDLLSCLMSIPTNHALPLD
jgi:hypothetical protein